MNDFGKHKEINHLYNRVPEIARSLPSANESFTENASASQSSGSSAAPLAELSTSNSNPKDKEVSESSDAYRDDIAISSLAGQLSSQSDLGDSKVESNKVQKEHAGQEAVQVSTELANRLQGTLQSRESPSSEMSLKGSSGDKERYWDQLMIHGSMLVLQERLGGMSASGSAGIRGFSVTAQESETGAITKLMNDYKESRSKKVQLHDSTEQMLVMAFKAAGVKEETGSGEKQTKTE